MDGWVILLPLWRREYRSRAMLITAKSVQPYVQVPGELIRIFSFTIVVVGGTFLDVITHANGAILPFWRSLSDHIQKSASHNLNSERKNSDKFPWNLDIWLYESNSPLESGHNFFFLRYILKAIYSFNETRHFFTNTFCLSHVFFTARTFDQPFKSFCLVNCFLHSVFNFIIPIPFLLFSTCSLFPLFLFLSFLSLFLFLLFLNSFSFFPL